MSLAALQSPKHANHAEQMHLGKLENHPPHYHAARSVLSRAIKRKLEGRKAFEKLAADPEFNRVVLEISVLDGVFFEVSGCAEAGRLRLVGGGLGTLCRHGLALHRALRPTAREGWRSGCQPSDRTPDRVFCCPQASSLLKGCFLLKVVRGAECPRLVAAKGPRGCGALCASCGAKPTKASEAAHGLRARPAPGTAAPAAAFSTAAAPAPPPAGPGTRPPAPACSRRGRRRACR